MPGEIKEISITDVKRVCGFFDHFPEIIEDFNSQLLNSHSIF
jgi:hypothetical protein